jgi:hypothetical protein
MPLSAPALSAAIRTSILSKGNGINDNAATTALCDAIAEAVVAHITSSAVVTVPALGLISPGGMTPAPVTGAATGSIA